MFSGLRLDCDFDLYGRTGAELADRPGQVGRTLRVSGALGC